MAPPLLDEKYAGVWSRTLLHTTENGVHEFDTTTTVRWVQSRRWFGDVRVPVAVAEGVKRPLLECGEAELALLSTQLAFAGYTTEVADPGGATSVVSWERCIDLKPPGGAPDTGRARWVNANKLYEVRATQIAASEPSERPQRGVTRTRPVLTCSAGRPGRHGVSRGLGALARVSW